MYGKHGRPDMYVSDSVDDSTALVGDADYAGNEDTRKSTTGYVYSLYGGAN